MNEIIIKNAQVLINNITYLYENLDDRDVFDEEDGEIAIQYQQYYEEVTEAYTGFRKFYEELLKRLDGDETAETWFLRVENAVHWIKYSHDYLGFGFDKLVDEMVKAYWEIMEAIE